MRSHTYDYLLYSHWNTQSSAREANTLTDCATTAAYGGGVLKLVNIFHFVSNLSPWKKP